jgi:hypothetical protein
MRIPQTQADRIGLERHLKACRIIFGTEVGLGLGGVVDEEGNVIRLHAIAKNSLFRYVFETYLYVLLPEHGDCYDEINISITGGEILQMLARIRSMP